jgi:hypothetical protein
MADVKRSPNGTADLAMAHSRGGMVHSFSERFKTRKRSLVAASSLGRWPVALTARRSLGLSASMAFVVCEIRRTSPEEAWEGTVLAEARRQLWLMAGYFRRHGLASKAPSAAFPAPASTARQISFSAAATSLQP